MPVGSAREARVVTPGVYCYGRVKIVINQFIGILGGGVGSLGYRGKGRGKYELIHRLGYRGAGWGSWGIEGRDGEHMN